MLLHGFCERGRPGRDRGGKAVGLLVIFAVLVVLSGAVLLPAANARAQDLEDAPPPADPGTGVASEEPAPTVETDVPADDVPPPTQDVTPTPEPAPTTTEPAPTTEPTPVVDPAPVTEPTPEPTPEPVVEPVPDPVAAPAPEPPGPAQEPVPASDPEPETVSVDDPASTPDTSSVPDPPPPLDPAPVPEAAVVPPATTAEWIPVAEPIVEEAHVPATPVASEPATALASAPVPVADQAPVPVAEPVPAAEPPSDTPPGPSDGAGPALEDAVLSAAVIPDSVDPPEGDDTKAAGTLEVEAANVPERLADGLLELAGYMFDTASEEAVYLTLRADEVAAGQLQVVTGLIEDVAGGEATVTPSPDPSPDVPAPVTPPAPVPIPAPTGGSSNCGFSGGSGQCGDNAYAVLSLGVLVGVFALGLSRGSAWAFDELLKPKSILLQVAERPG